MSTLRRPSFSEAVAAANHSVCGMMAEGPARAALLRRLLQCSDAVLTTLRGVSTPEFVALVHERDAEGVPWVDGATYLCAASGAPGLLLPTTARIDVPADAVLAALQRRHPTLTTPFALWPAHGFVVPLAGALPLDRDLLRAALENP